MKLVLLEKVKNLGAVGAVVTVKAGYGRNYLLPTGKAALATEGNLAHFEKQRAELEKHEQERLANAQTREKELQGLTIEIAARASDEGKLFGSVGPREIAEFILSKGIDVHKSDIDLIAGPIRQTGEHEIAIRLHSDVVAHKTINVIPEQQNIA